MKGLLLKDIYVSRKYLVWMLVFGLLYGGVMMLFYRSDEGNAMQFVSSILSVVFAIMVLNSFAYDEQARWPSYAMTMPVSRWEYAGARYLYALLLTLCGGLLSFVVQAAAYLIALVQKKTVSFAELWTNSANILISLSIGMVIISVMLPLVYQFGLQKTRLILVVFYSGTIFAAPALLETLSAENPSWFSGPGIFLFAGVAIFAGSFFISNWVLSRKEF